jgi:hypothetical protein
MRRKIRWSLLVLVGVMALPTTAQARVFFFQYGDVLTEMGELPTQAAAKLPRDIRSEEGAGAARAAYKCTELSVLWTLIYRSDCQAVVMRNGAVLKSPKKKLNQTLSTLIAAEYPGGPPEGEGWEKHGKWGVGALFLLFFIAPIFRRKSAF